MKLFHLFVLVFGAIGFIASQRAEAQARPDPDVLIVASDEVENAAAGAVPADSKKVKESVGRMKGDTSTGLLLGFLKDHVTGQDAWLDFDKAWGVYLSCRITGEGTAEEHIPFRITVVPGKKPKRGRAAGTFCMVRIENLRVPLALSELLYIPSDGSREGCDPAVFCVNPEGQVITPSKADKIVLGARPVLAGAHASGADARLWIRSRMNQDIAEGKSIGDAMKSVLLCAAKQPKKAPEQAIRRNQRLYAHAIGIVAASSLRNQFSEVKIAGVFDGLGKELRDATEKAANKGLERVLEKLGDYMKPLIVTFINWLFSWFLLIAKLPAAIWGALLSVLRVPSFVFIC